MKKIMIDIKNHLMTGISYALPVIIAGSLMVAVAKIIGLIVGEPNLDAFAKSDGLMNWLYLTQDVGFKIIGLMNYVLGAYVAFSIAGKKGLAAGFTAGLIASMTGSGFLGAVLGGLFVGVGREQNSYYRLGVQLRPADYSAVYHRGFTGGDHAAVAWRCAELD